MKIKKSLMLISALFLFIGISFAATTAETETVEQEAIAVLTGNLLDAETGEAIPEATVTLNETGEAATTDENGGFAFEVEPGDYTLSVEADGYADHDEDVSVPEEGAHLEIEVTSEY